MNRKMTDYEIVDTNAENISRCSLCRYKDANNLGYRRKTDWLKQRYAGTEQEQNRVSPYFKL